MMEVIKLHARCCRTLVVISLRCLVNEIYNLVLRGNQDGPVMYVFGRQWDGYGFFQAGYGMRYYPTTLQPEAVLLV